MGKMQHSETYRRYSVAAVNMLDGGLEHLVGQQGGVCLGISIRSTQADTLLVIRAEFPAGRMVAFVGGSSGVQALAKADRQLRNGGLTWRPDRFAKPQAVKEA